MRTSCIIFLVGSSLVACRDDLPIGGATAQDAGNVSPSGDSGGATPVEVGVTGAPAQIAVDENNVYSATWQYGPVQSLPLAGGANVILDGPGADVIAINSTTVFSRGPMTFSPDPGYDGLVVSCAKTGCSQGFTTLATNQNAYALAADEGAVYWRNMTSNEPDGGSTTGLIMAAPLDGGALETLVDFQTIEGVGDIITWGDDLLFDFGNQQIATIPKTGGTPRVVVTVDPSDGYVVWLAADPTNVFFSTRLSTATGDTGKIMRAPLDGSTPPIVIANDASPGDEIAIDDTYVYWAGYYSGLIQKAPLAGGPSTTLASEQLGPMSIAVDATNVYWGNIGDNGIFKIAK